MTRAVEQRFPKPRRHDGRPAWVACESCGAPVCSIHLKHVAECSCPPRSEMRRHGRVIDPFKVGGRRIAVCISGLDPCEAVQPSGQRPRNVIVREWPGLQAGQGA